MGKVKDKYTERLDLLAQDELSPEQEDALMKEIFEEAEKNALEEKKAAFMRASLTGFGLGMAYVLLIQYIFGG